MHRYDFHSGKTTFLRTIAKHSVVHRIPHTLYGPDQGGFERLLRGPADPVGRKPQVPACSQIHCSVTNGIREATGLKEKKQARVEIGSSGTD